MQLIDKLTTLQRTLGISDADFATKIGMDDAQWTNIRNRKRGIGRKNLSRIYSAYPELKEEIFEYTIGERAVA